jgi:hypothetical protein
MPKCTRCNGSGIEEIEEDGRMIRDACYHCSNTGEIDEHTLYNDRLESVANTLAYHEVREMRMNRNSDPYGEGWDFCAAENGMTAYEYTQVAMWNKLPEIYNQLSLMPKEDQKLLIEWNEYNAQ